MRMFFFFCVTIVCASVVIVGNAMAMLWQGVMIAMCARDNALTQSYDCYVRTFFFISGTIVCASVVIVAMAMLWHGVKIAMCACFLSLAPLFALVLLLLLWQCFDMELDNKKKEILDEECIRVASKQTHLVIPQVVLMRWAHV